LCCDNTKRVSRTVLDRTLGRNIVSDAEVGEKTEARISDRRFSKVHDGLEVKAGGCLMS
jgi:hypothetical protein